MDIDDTRIEMIYRILEYYTDTNLMQPKDEMLAQINKGDYISIFLRIKKPNRIAAFKDIFDLLPDNHVYPLFIDVYSDVEYGFHRFTKKITDRVSKFKPDALAQELCAIADNGHNITIYRGEGTESTPLKKALSWTLDYNTAVFFAKRFNYSGIGIIYAAQISFNKVIAFINDREEKEILARCKDLKNIVKNEIKCKIPKDVEGEKQYALLYKALHSGN